MAQNVYDDPEFFAGYSRLPRQVLGLDGAPEWPTVRTMLPDIRHTRIIDLGCGFGWTARWMRTRGAASVHAIDLSRNMIERARADTADPQIVYEIADIEALDLPDAAYDLAFSSLAFHYVEDFARLARAFHRALVPGGHLVFTIEHPIFMAAQQADWLELPGQPKTWPVNRYAVEGERISDWFAPGVVKHHRRMATTLNTLIESGFTLLRVEEFAPSTEQVERDPLLAEDLERPMMLLVSARR